MKSLHRLLFHTMILFALIGLASANEKPKISEISLTNHFGENFDMQAIHGKVAVILFGYTSCPDVCPMGLTHISTILKGLGADSKDLVAIFISVDPNRDTPDVLRSYVSWFHQDIVGLTGSAAQIDAVTKAFNVQYAINRKSSGDNNYSVDHSSGFYLLDTTTTLQQIVPFGLPIEHTLESVKNLIRKARARSQ